MRLKIIFLTLIGILCFPKVFADSPLTATPFHEAYQEEKIVQVALNAAGVITPKLMKYLSHPKKPIAIKLAIINALGWNFDGQHNAELFYAYLKDRKKLNELENNNAELQICYAYLKAMDNYFEVKEALEYANRARSKSSSYAGHLVASLIEAQKKMETDWCGVYLASDQVRNNSDFNLDFNSGASAIIFNYMELYAKYCPKE
jgi:hypothetical protein